MQHISGDSSKGRSKLSLSEDFDNQISLKKQKHTEFALGRKNLLGLLMSKVLGKFKVDFI